MACALINPLSIIVELINFHPTFDLGHGSGLDGKDTDVGESTNNASKG